MADLLSAWTLPGCLLLLSLLFLFSRKDLGGAFARGASQGLQTMVQVLPTLVLMLTAVGMFTASGAPAFLERLLAPVLERIGIPSALATLLAVRPFSGSASNGVLADLFAGEGPDSPAGRVASVLAGSSDTVFYVAALYCSAGGIRRSRHLLPVACLVMLFTVVMTAFVCSLWFRYAG